MKYRTTLLTLASIGALSLALYGQAPATEATKTPPAPEVAAGHDSDEGAGIAPAGETEESDASAPSDLKAAAPTTAAPPPSAPRMAPPPMAAPMGPMAAPEPPPLSPERQARHEEMQKRYEKSLEERNARYQDLRRRAEEAGVSLPEIPPWTQQSTPQPPGMQRADVRERLGQGGAEPPKGPVGSPAAAAPLGQPPQPPVPSAGRLSSEERDAVREQRYQQMRERAKAHGTEMPETPPWKLATDEERREHREKMSEMTPAERRTYRQEIWNKMRERAKEQGFDVSDTGPWQQPPPGPWLSEDARERYQAILDQMTPEQREAAQAIYGSPMPPRMTPPEWASQRPTDYGPQGYGYGYGAPPPKGTGCPSAPGRGRECPGVTGRPCPRSLRAMARDTGRRRVTARGMTHPVVTAPAMACRRLMVRPAMGPPKVTDPAMVRPKATGRPTVGRAMCHRLLPPATRLRVPVISASSAKVRALARPR